MVADAITVSFFTTFERQAPGGMSIFVDSPPGSEFCIVIPQLKKVLYKFLKLPFALILKLYGTIHHTILKT
jgi:hypothetical protein